MPLAPADITAAGILSNTADIVSPVAGGGGGGGGTLKRVGQEILVPQPFENYGGTNSYYLAQTGITSHTLNAVGEFAYLIAKVPERLHGKTIKKVYFGLHAIDATGDVGFSIGKTFSSGVPSANADSVSNTLLATKATRHTISATFPTGMAVSRGETFFVGIASTSCQIRVLHTGGRNDKDLIQARCYYNTGTPVTNNFCIPIVLEASDGTVAHIEGLPFCIEGDVYNTYTQGNGCALRLTTPFGATVAGIWASLYNFIGATDGEATWALLDEDESSLGSVVVASRETDYPANKPGIFAQYFSTPVDITEGQDVYVSLKHTGASGDSRPYEWVLSDNATHAEAICKSIPGYELWNVRPYDIASDVLTAKADKTLLPAMGLILSHIK